MKNITLQDIADELGLTKVSISKALRDHPDISEETRKKVKKMAKKLGYRPNLVARSLTSSKSKTIGLIIPKIAHYFFASVVESIYKTAFEHGYEVIIGVSLEDDELEKTHLETMMQMRVDGLLVSITEKTKDIERFEEVRDMGIDLVFFDRGFKDKGFSYLKAEDRKSAYEGVKHLIDEGYEEIAHLAGYGSVEIGKNRTIGYLDALKEAGITPNDNLIVEGGFSEEDGYKSFKKLLNDYGLPKAIFAVTYPVGLGALKCMKENDIDPREVKVLTFGKSDFNEYLISPFICIDQPTGLLGVKAVKKLLAEIEADDHKPVVEELSSGIST
ncbi:LacI family DNA-binding transcriptional regulator [Gracilimonas mengyeensis]|uniref:Transcriptional regulator, LacI family n=1 Tax=Gracilimonas mengyeensis TaxID=1302730 RepID=A0A521FDA5_9BACT|nr:LacI family DNA-binding transcriptional regulator [Gracilimonas mengyeensis]SMO94156.1 transcriptional regulator, LacI family [Gracilimonas mengyeensis]